MQQIDLDNPQLPFEPRQQDAILGYATLAENFFVQVKDRIKPNWFVDSQVGKVYDLYCKFYATYQHVPKSNDEFFMFEEFFLLAQAEKVRYKAVLLRCRETTKDFSLDVLRSGLTGWLQTRIYHEKVNKSGALYNQRKFSAAKELLAETVRELQNVSFEGQAPASLDPWALIRNIDEQNKSALTFGHPLIDETLNPDCPTGSLLGGDATVLLAPTNVGKTTTKLTIALSNAVRGNPVLFIAHEGRESDLVEKMWQNVLRASRQEFRGWVLSQDKMVTERLSAFWKGLEENFTLIHRQQNENYVEDVISQVRQLNERRKNKYGTGYAMLVNDYPAILGTRSGAHQKERRHKDSYVYRYMVDYVGSEKIHGLFSVQTNREGSKKNRRATGFENSRTLVTLEDIQEAFEVSNSATNLITINRSPEDQERNLITYLICKSRSSAVNVAVACKSDFSRARSHAADWPATRFFGTSALDGIEKLVLEYQNRSVPHNYKEIRRGNTNEQQ